MKHDLGRITDDMEREEIQECMASVRKKLRKANEKIVKLETKNKYWRNCYQGAYPPIQQLHHAALPQDTRSNTEDISAQLHEIKDWIHDIIQDGRNFLPLSRHFGHWWLLETDSKHLRSGRISFQSRTWSFPGYRQLLGYQRDFWRGTSWSVEEETIQLSLGMSP